MLGFIVLLIGLVVVHNEWSRIYLSFSIQAVASWTVSEAQRIEAEQKKAKELAEQKDEAETSKDTRSNTDETKKER